MNRYVQKALDASARVKHHRAEMARYSLVRARNVLRAVESEDEPMTREQVAEALGVTVSTVNKAITVARDPEAGRARWQGNRGEQRT